MKELLEKLFASRDTALYPPCGMFTPPHFIALAVTVACVALALLLSQKITKEKIKLVCKIFAVLFTLLECVKIGYNHINGYTWLDAWFPLAYCSLFIYSLYFAGFGNERLEKYGFAFLAGGGVLAGSFFLVFPTTSLMLHPIYHYLCLYSMTFHGAMVYIALLILWKRAYKTTLKGWWHYLCFIAPFSVLAIAMNHYFDCNMMFYGNPYNLPLQFVVDLHAQSQAAYTALIFAAYSLLYPVTYSVYHLLKKYLAKEKK